MQYCIQRMILSGIVYFLTFSAYAASASNISYNITGLSSESVTLHRIIFYICCGISTIVVSILLYSLIKLRYANNNAGTYFHKYLVIDIFWTILPFLILVALIFPAAKLLFQY